MSKYKMPTKPSRTFIKGDFVDCMNGDHTYMSTRKIICVGKTFVMTSCGRKWDQRGWWIGSQQTWPFPWIRHSKRKAEFNAD